MSITAPNFSLQRNDDEAVLDRRGTRCQQGTNFEQEDLEGTWRNENRLFQQMIVLSTAFERVWEVKKKQWVSRVCINAFHKADNQMMWFLSSALMKGSPVSILVLNHETVKPGWSIWTQLQSSGSTRAHWAVGAECRTQTQHTQTLKRADVSIMSQDAQIHTGWSETVTLPTLLWYVHCKPAIFEYTCSKCK